MIPLTRQAQQYIAKRLQAGDTAIDATTGNGHDTLFLASHAGADGRVFGFDIQQSAIAATRQRLLEHGQLDNVELMQCSHEQMIDLIPPRYQGSIAVIMFNLGYLPGSDKSCITRTDSTLAALQQSLQLLGTTGLLSVMLYPGHAGGAEEAQAVHDWADNLDSGWCVSQAHTAGPEWLLIEKNTSN